MTLLSDAQVVDFIEKHVGEIFWKHDDGGNPFWRIWLRGSNECVDGSDLRTVISYACSKKVANTLTP